VAEHQGLGINPQDFTRVSDGGRAIKTGVERREMYLIESNARFNPARILSAGILDNLLIYSSVYD
jgi:hypothetical protein